LNLNPQDGLNGQKSLRLSLNMI